MGFKMPACTFEKPCPLYKCHNSLLHPHYVAQQSRCGRRESTRFYYPARSKTLPSSKGSPNSVKQKQQIFQYGEHIIHYITSVIIKPLTHSLKYFRIQHHPLRSVSSLPQRTTQPITFICLKSECIIHEIQKRIVKGLRKIPCIT